MISTDFGKVLDFSGTAGNQWADPYSDLDPAQTWQTLTNIRGTNSTLLTLLSDNVTATAPNARGQAVGGLNTGSNKTVCIEQMGTRTYTSFQMHFRMVLAQGSQGANMMGWVFKWNGSTGTARRHYYLGLSSTSLAGSPPNKTGGVTASLWTHSNITWTSLGSVSTDTNMAEESNIWTRPFDLWLTCEQRASDTRLAVDMAAAPGSSRNSVTAGPLEVIDSTSGVWDTDGTMGIASGNPDGQGYPANMVGYFQEIEVHSGPKDSPTLMTRGAGNMALAAMQRGWS